MQYLFLLAVAPVIFLLAYIRNKDPNQEPKNLLKKIFIFGCLTVIPVLIFETLYDGLFIGEKETESFSDIFFGVALIEEFFKWLVVYALCYKAKHFDETYDAIVYAGYSSLAFACIENIGYVFLEGGAFVAILRALTAVPGHLCDGIIMGYYIGKARHAKSQKRGTFGLLFCSLFVPTLAHCIYDYLLEIESVALWLLFFFVSVIICISIVKKAAKNNIAITDETTAA